MRSQAKRIQEISRNEKNTIESALINESVTNQSRIDSIFEVLTNIFIGAVIALAAQVIWFPMIGKQFTVTENLLTTMFFTVVSFLRSYWLRRWFNGRSVYQSIKQYFTQ